MNLIKSTVYETLYLEKSYESCTSNGVGTRYSEDVGFLFISIEERPLEIF